MCGILIDIVKELKDLKRWGLLLVMIAGMLLMSSCSLLPEEETFSAAPLIRQYEREEFKFAFAERGNMVLEQKISCTYVPVQTEGLRFKIGGEYFGEIFVKVGDSVKKGQLLAQLNLDGVGDRIESCRMQIDKLGMRIAALEENRALALDRQRILHDQSTREELNRALESVNEQYDSQKRSLEDELEIALLQLSEYEQELSDRQLRAGIDGTVTFVRGVRSGDRSVAGERFMTIADARVSLFRSETKLWNEFEPGDEILITANKKEYEAVVASEEELGLPPQEKVADKEAYVYFLLKAPAFDLEDGDRGTIVLTLDSRTDVLMVPESAISSANGQSIVYYQNEEGLKAYKPVETGLVANKMIEIISGLTEGESVIVE